jgi:hypothetical protein
MMFTVTQAQETLRRIADMSTQDLHRSLSIHVEPLTTRNRIMNKKTITGQFNFALGKFRKAWDRCWATCSCSVQHSAARWTAASCTPSAKRRT